MVKSLDKKWKSLLFAFSGFGPNLLMVTMGAYFTDAINPAAMGDNTLQVISGTCLILPGIFPILWMLSRVFDGIIDIPLAAFTDSLSTKWGRRRPTIAVSLIPMYISFVMMWIPLSSQLAYTIWIFFWGMIFFTSYTMCMISYYGSFSMVCRTSTERVVMSSYKAFFETITYCVAYALVPLLLGVLNMRIDKFILSISPLMFTMLFPLFIIKEGKKYGYPENEGLKEEKVSMFKSLKLTFSNRLFLRWLVVNCCAFFGLQIFLVAMNAMVIGGMGFSSVDMAILNTFAFAPVPVMLYLFNKVKARKGIRFGMQVCLLAFAVAIFSFVLASKFVVGEGNKMLQYVIAITGAVCASFSIGVFFMMPYVIPSQIASVEERVTGVNHSAMYFAAQAVTTSVVGAISGGVVYENIKMLFIHKPTGTVVRALDAAEAASKMGVGAEQVYNLGVLLVPFVVSIMCILGFIVTLKMPKDFTNELVAKELKKHNKDVDLSKVEPEKIEDKDSALINCALWVLSGSLFGLMWSAFAMGKAHKITGDRHTALKWLMCTVIPFAGIIYMLGINKKLSETAKAKNVKIYGKGLYAVFAFLLPILPLNIIGLSLLTVDVEKLSE